MSTATIPVLVASVLAPNDLPPSRDDVWLRAVVADRLGVSEASIASHVSLRDDLAADSLDFADLAAAIEAEVGIAVPRTLLRQVRTYGDLVALAHVLTRERAERARDGAALVRTRLSRPAATIERVFTLDPYALEIVLDDALQAEPGAWLEVFVDAGTSRAILARVRGRLARLERRGVGVRIRRAA